jgi:hypothetical protein
VAAKIKICDAEPPEAMHNHMNDVRHLGARGFQKFGNLYLKIQNKLKIIGKGPKLGFEPRQKAPQASRLPSYLTSATFFAS